MKKVFFLSDTHLGAAYFPDSKSRETKVVAFLDSIKEEASEIYLLGDILDYWYEYRYVVPRGYVRFFGKLAELSDAGIKITWMIGNHDIWIFDYIPSELGITVVDGNLVTDILGSRMLLAHGDGVWQHSRKFKFLRSLFRNRFCQFLFAGIHPRWTVAFANAWSRHSREVESCDSQKMQAMKVKVKSNMVHLMDFCRNYNTLHPDISYYIFGHLHIIADEPVGPKARMIILGDWIDKFSYAVFDGKEMKIETFKS